MEEEKFHNPADSNSVNNLQAAEDFSVSSAPKADISDLKILLWDIDGTLLQSTRPGGFREYFGSAMEKTFGTKGGIAEVKAAGATDTQIVFEALKGDGYTIEQISARMNKFIEILDAEIQDYVERNEDVYEILPGVKEILQATDADPQFVNALLTGNVKCGTESKCRYVGIWQYFKDSLNTYGDVSHDRKQLAVAAGKNYNGHYRSEINPAQFVVIGDTIYDILTAKNFGAKVLSVETGRGINREELSAEQPDVLIADLSNTQKVLKILESI